MSVTVRTARSDDLGIVHDIRRDAILGISGDFEASERQGWADRRSPEFFAERVAAGEVVLAVSGSRGVGWGSSSGDHISGVYVRSSSGRTGVGRAIVSRLESDIVRRGHECATLDSSPGAVGFYVKLGYTPVGPRNDDGAVPMRKALRTTSVAIRRAIPGDEPALAELNAFVHDLHVGGNPVYFKPASHQEVAAWFRGLLEQPGVRIWIAEGDGAAVGYVIALLRERPENVFGRSRRWLEIDQIGVRPGHRRMGIGRALIRVVLEAADDDGIHDVELSTWVFNGGAQEAFRRLGFTPQVVRFGRESSTRRRQP